ncbi:hypothetical protein GCM10029964_093260 [Kibdelosporangium lantanae]
MGGRKRLVSAVVAVAVAGSVALVPAATASAEGCADRFTFLDADAVRVRATPGGRVLGLAWYGTRLELHEKSGRWQRVSFPLRNQIKLKSGWIDGSFVGVWGGWC